MPPNQLLLPARLCRIDAEKAKQAVPVLVHVRRNFLVRHPNSSELCLATEDNRPPALSGSCLIFFPADSKVHLHTVARSRRLHDEVGREVVWIGKEMAVNINDHVNSQISGQLLPSRYHGCCPCERFRSRTVLRAGQKPLIRARQVQLSASRAPRSGANRGARQNTSRTCAAARE